MSVVSFYHTSMESALIWREVLAVRMVITCPRQSSAPVTGSDCIQPGNSATLLARTHTLDHTTTQTQGQRSSTPTAVLKPGCKCSMQKRLSVAWRAWFLQHNLYCNRLHSTSKHPMVDMAIRLGDVCIGRNSPPPNPSCISSSF